jgi:hypothetical protein
MPAPNCIPLEVELSAEIKCENSGPPNIRNFVSPHSCAEISFRFKTLKVKINKSDFMQSYYLKNNIMQSYKKKEIK